jgi:hypothetical protein
VKATAGGLYLDTCVLVSLFHNDSGYAAAEIGSRKSWKTSDASGWACWSPAPRISYWQGVGSSRNGTSACGPAMACTWP